MRRTPLSTRLRHATVRAIDRGRQAPSSTAFSSNRQQCHVYTAAVDILVLCVFVGHQCFQTLSRATSTTVVHGHPVNAKRRPSRRSSCNARNPSKHSWLYTTSDRWYCRAGPTLTSCTCPNTMKPYVTLFVYLYINGKGYKPLTPALVCN